MNKTARILSAMLTALSLAAAIAPVLSGQEMNDQDRILFQKYRMTRPDVLKGESQLKKKQYDKAEQSLLKALQEMPENAEASFFLAETYYEKADYERALAAIVVAEKNIPLIQKTLYRTQTGTIFKGGESRAELENQILAEQQKSGQPTSTATSRMSGQAAADQTKSQEQKSEIFGVPAEYSYLHGNILVRLKRYDEALASFEQAVVADPKHGRALNNIANFYFMGRQYDKALEYIEKAEAVGAKVNPDFKKAVLQALGR